MKPARSTRRSLSGFAWSEKKSPKQSRVPPYVVFSDKTLHEMCRHFPKTASEMRRISGVGDVKLERYGEAFLDEIKTFGEKKE